MRRPNTPEKNMLDAMFKTVAVRDDKDCKLRTYKLHIATLHVISMR